MIEFIYENHLPIGILSNFSSSISRFEFSFKYHNFDDHAFVTNLLEKGAAIEKMAEEKEREIVTIVEQKIKELAK
jgi:UDP-N-acetylmuramyl pentapeptide synthase